MVSRVKAFSNYLSDQFPVLYQNRYCDQKELCISFFSDYNYSRDISTLKPYLLNNFDTKTYLLTLSKLKYDCKVVTIGRDIYVLGHFIDYNTLSVVKCCSLTKSWFKLPETKEVEQGYYVSYFIQKVFIIIESNYENSWYYDIKTNKWTSIASMIEKRRYVACTGRPGGFSGGFLRYFFPRIDPYFYRKFFTVDRITFF